MKYSDVRKSSDSVLYGSESPAATQDRLDPVVGTEQAPVYQEMVIRATNRDPKDILTLQSGIMTAESVYYPNQERLFDLYSDILRDARVRGVIRKLVAQIVNKKLLFMNNDEEVPELKKLIPKKAFKDMCREILWTPFWGLNGFEFIPGDKLAFNLVPKKHIKPKTKLITYQQWGLTDGIDYTKLKNIWILGDEHAIGGNGAERDLGLLFILAYYALLKKGVISDWAQYIQIFGSPTVIIKYKGFDPQAKAAAENILNNLGSFNRIALPEEMTFEPVESKGTSGTGDLQDKFIHICDQAIEILVLGNTETTGHDKTGTGGKSKTHSEQQLEIVRDAMDYLVGQLNSDHFMNILKSYGYPVEGGEFVFDKEVDIAYLKDYIPLVVSVGTQLGLPLSKKALYESLGTPAPKTPEDTIQLHPTLGQQESSEPDEEDGKPSGAAPGKPAPKKKKPQPQALSKAEVSAMLDEKFAAFFGQAPS